jgi:hypothetical protein
MNDGAFCLPGSFLCVDALSIDLLFAFDLVLWLPGVLLLLLNSRLWLPVIVSKHSALANGIFFEILNITIKTSISTTRKREI